LEQAVSTLPASVNPLWTKSWEVLYKAYYYELTAEHVVARWERIDIAVIFLVTATASGSAVAGWSLWSDPGWRIVWLVIAGLATIMSIGHGAVAVPRRVKEQEKIRRTFSWLRVSLETIRRNLDGDPESEEAKEALRKFHEIEREFDRAVADSPKDIALTLNLQNRVQHQLNNILKGGTKNVSSAN
jgi:hypothetical protein